MADKVRYVEGFVLVVPKKNVEAYRKLAEQGRESWMRHGALDYKECVLDADRVPGATSTFKKLLKLKPGETAFYSFIGYRSKAHRDAVNKRVMKEWKAKKGTFEMPMDPKRMTAAGFKVLVSN